MFIKGRDRVVGPDDRQVLTLDSFPAFADDTFLFIDVLQLILRFREGSHRTSDLLHSVKETTCTTIQMYHIEDFGPRALLVFSGLRLTSLWRWK